MPGRLRGSPLIARGEEEWLAAGAGRARCAGRVVGRAKSGLAPSIFHSTIAFCKSNREGRRRAGHPYGDIPDVRSGLEQLGRGAYRRYGRLRSAGSF